MFLLAVLATTGVLAVALVLLALLGGRGDHGDGIRQVELPEATSRLGRVGLMLALVLLSAAMLAYQDHNLLLGMRFIVSHVLRGTGLGTEQTVAYQGGADPLLGAILIMSLLLEQVIRPSEAASLAIGLAVTLLTAVTVVSADAAAVTLAAVTAIPVDATVYLVNLTTLFVGLLGFFAATMRTAALPRRYLYPAVVSGASSGLAITSIGAVALLAGLVGFRLIAAVLQPIFPGSVLVVFLVLPVTFSLFQILLFVFRRKERPGHPPRVDVPIDVIMPAWNEERLIGATLAAIDHAAAAYPGPVRVIVSDDGSTDGTAQCVRAAAAAAQAAEITLLRGPHLGKAPALNRALEYATAELVVRIDADTLVTPGIFGPLPAWFANPAVGCVGAFDLPNPALRAWYTKGRLFECLYTFGFSRLAYERFDGNNIPGTFMAFRRADALAVGGIVEGMNGEDSDLTFNLGRVGLVSVLDPAIVIYEDVPQTAAAFISQRTRWGRASVQLAARHLPRAGTEYTGRYAVQLRFVYNKMSALLRPVTYLAGAVLVLSDGRPGSVMLRGLGLLAIGFVPEFSVLIVLAITYRFWRQLPWLVIWAPFTIIRKIGMLNGIMSIPPYRWVRPARQQEASRLPVPADAG